MQLRVRFNENSQRPNSCDDLLNILLIILSSPYQELSLRLREYVSFDVVRLKIGKADVQLTLPKGHCFSWKKSSVSLDLSIPKEIQGKTTRQKLRFLLVWEASGK